MHVAEGDCSVILTACLADPVMPDRTAKDPQCYLLIYLWASSAACDCHPYPTWHHSQQVGHFRSVQSFIITRRFHTHVIPPTILWRSWGWHNCICRTSLKLREVEGLSQGHNGPGTTTPAPGLLYQSSELPSRSKEIMDIKALCTLKSTVTMQGI